MSHPSTGGKATLFTSPNRLSCFPLPFHTSGSATSSSELRSTVSSLQKERNTLIESVAKQRAKAKSELLKNLNPIVKNYMKEKKIRMVVDKKNVLLADENLDITKDIITLLNQKLKSIKLN